MNWTKIKESLPKEPGFYECYFPESKMFRVGHCEFWFDGKDFRDGDSIFGGRKSGKRINNFLSHWMKIEHPQP